MPASEKKWQQRYQKAPSFLSLHLGVEASVIPAGTACHHILLEDWDKMEAPEGTVLVSIPTVLDQDLAPEGYHIVHAFTSSWMEEWEGLSQQEYEDKKEEAAGRIIDRLEKIFPGFRCWFGLYGSRDCPFSPPLFGARRWNLRADSAAEVNGFVGNAV